MVRVTCEQASENRGGMVSAAARLFAERPNGASVTDLIRRLGMVAVIVISARKKKS